MRIIGIMASILFRPTRILHAGFLLLAFGVASNALFLQEGQHPAPLFGERDVVPEQSAASSAAGEASEQIPAEPARTGPDELTLALQRALRQQGFYAGPIDGIAGPMTTSAIEAYERAAGKPLTGTASLELLADLTSQPAEEEGDAAPAGQPAEPDPQLMAVQLALSRAAYGPVPADGIFGPQTRDAIARFQSDHGLPVTGEYNEALMLDLRAVGAIETE